LSVYMWICRTTKIKPSAEGFASAHQVHHQWRTVFEEEGGPNCRERLPIWLPELLVQVRRRQPRDRISQQVAFRLAAAMAVPHRNSACSGGVASACYEGAAPSTTRIQKIRRAPKVTSLS
jgi:hypothetical protein